MYRIYYNDGTWLDYEELDDAHFNGIMDALKESSTHFISSKLLLKLTDIRSIRWIEQEPETETQSYSPELSAEEKEYIENYRLAERLHAEMESKKVNASYEYEFGDGDL